MVTSKEISDSKQKPNIPYLILLLKDEFLMFLEVALVSSFMSFIMDGELDGGETRTGCEKLGKNANLMKL